VAGLNGMPRRVLDVAYDGTAPQLWTAISPIIGIGAAIMSLSLLFYVALLVGTALGTGRQQALAAPMPFILATKESAAVHQKAWTAPICVLALIIGMYAATILAFALLRALPLASSAGASH
jgi:cytochrome c oxidase subunit I